MGKLGNINSLPTNEEIDIFVKQKFFGERILNSDGVQKYILRAKNIWITMNTFGMEAALTK